jgi:transcriptional regulator with XRE-family HTH domain
VSALAETLRVRREEVGLSQAQLAARIGVGQQAVSRWERGEAVPRPARVVALAEVLGLEAAALHRLAGYLEDADRSPLWGPFHELFARMSELSSDELWLLTDRAWQELRGRYGYSGTGSR